ncbi:L-fucose mutarotase [compost metagenome]
MLKKIPKLLSPELVKIMMEMGHGDELVLAETSPGMHCIPESSAATVSVFQSCWLRFLSCSRWIIMRIIRRP